MIDNIKPEQMKTDVFLKSTRQALTLQSKQFEYDLKRSADNGNSSVEVGCPRARAGGLLLAGAPWR